MQCCWHGSICSLRASITVGGEQAESSLAEREKERERAASVLRDAGLKRAKTHSLRSHSLLSCCASFLFAACAAGKLLPHLLKATLEFIRRRTSCIINSKGFCCGSVRYVRAKGRMNESEIKLPPKNRALLQKPTTTYEIVSDDLQ